MLPACSIPLNCRAGISTTSTLPNGYGAWHVHGVLASLQMARGNDEVIVDRFDRDGRAVRDDRDVQLFRRREVDH